MSVHDDLEKTAAVLGTALCMCDEVGFPAHGPNAAKVLLHRVDERYRRHSMVFVTNKPLERWGRVLHGPDLAEAIFDRILERGRIVTLKEPSIHTRHLDAVLCGSDHETSL